MRICFDLGRVDTYYTRPMSEAWSKPCDVGALADEQADLELAIPLAEFSRVRTRLGALEGTISARVRFGRVRLRAAGMPAVSEAHALED